MRILVFMTDSNVGFLVGLKQGQVKMGGVTRKGPLMAVSYQKKDGHDTDFSKKKKKEKSKKSVSYQKKGGRGHARQFFFWYANDSGH